ncbi:dienelactone hydrolase family protein [Methylotetracoccus oryzae]|uniref:dienelactone hydrolase family protein n=1 Tax=Methylotetracoccus oryzae TaxID=1919059 RepID=UPI00111A0982|nr:dienelactone hydrolase family protein [Methylotetracoccus oryzae]
MPHVTRTIDYRHGTQPLEGFLAYDESVPGPLPAVLIAHAWGGRDEFVCGKARRLAELGYAAFALDMYGKGVLGTGPEQNAQLMQPFMADRALLQGRMKQALETVKALPQVDPERVAAMGFCFGGLCVLDLARSGADLRGVISFHGLFMPPTEVPNQPIRAKVLALHGYDDPMVPPDQVTALAQELTEAGADWQIHMYGHTAHAFTNPAANDPAFGTVYDATADERSWQSLQSFLREVLT